MDPEATESSLFVRALVDGDHVIARPEGGGVDAAHVIARPEGGGVVALLFDPVQKPDFLAVSRFPDVHTSSVLSATKSVGNRTNPKMENSGLDRKRDSSRENCRNEDHDPNAVLVTNDWPKTIEWIPSTERSLRWLR